MLLHRTIPLTQGKAAIIDAEDYERVVIAGPWYALLTDDTWYAMHSDNANRTTMLLHRFVIGAPKGAQVDHRDCNGLNCRKENLRLCTNSQNQGNRRPNKKSSSRYKGVYWDKVCQKWRAQIQVNGRKIKLGNFSRENDAARVYNQAAINAFGDFARINIIEG